MSSRGETIENPLIGYEFRFFKDRFRILQSSRDTHDGSLRFDYFAAPGANVPEHVHHPWEDCFEVLSGTLGVRVGEQELMLGPGQSAVVPPSVRHAWWNPSDEEQVRFLTEIRPGLDVEIMFETVLGLAREGKTVGGIIPKNPLQLAVLAHEFGSWGHFTGIPGPMRKALFAPVRTLAFVGRLLGYRARHPEYSGPEAVETVRIEQSVEIERPPEEVFAFVVDPRNDEQWTPAVEKTRKTSEGPLGAGTTFESVFHLLGRRFQASFEIAEYEPNRKVVLGNPLASGPLRLTGTRSVEAAPGGTRLTITVEGRSGGFFGVGEPIFARLAKRPLKAALANLKSTLESAPGEPAESLEPPAPDKLLLLVSALWLMNSAVGAAVAIREDLPGEFAGMTSGRVASADFLRAGTALSPGLPMMTLLAVFTVLSTRGGKAETVGVAGMTALGAGGTVGVLGESITYRSLSPGKFDPAKAAIASAATVLSALMALLSARRLLGSRRR